MDNGLLLLGMILLMIFDLVGLVVLLIALGWGSIGWYIC